jgi:hypothetical protein
MDEDRGAGGPRQGATSPIEWALAYAEFELRVATARANHELLISPKRATCDPDIIVALWSRWPFADITWLLPPTILAVVIDNRYRRLAHFGGADAQRRDARNRDRDRRRLSLILGDIRAISQPNRDQGLCGGRRGNRGSVRLAYSFAEQRNWPGMDPAIVGNASRSRAELG